MKNVSALTVFASAILTLCIILLSDQSSASRASMECKKVEVITARGSGDEGGKANDDETDRYYKNIVNSLPSSNIGIQQYILGTESYGNHQYPHVDVTNLLVAAGAIKGQRSS